MSTTDSDIEIELTEPDAVWPEAPRYCPDYELPPYRYVKGLHPHPERDPKGHFHTNERPSFSRIAYYNWEENESYLYGFDLYHQGYLWESHEAWESIWTLTEKDSRERNLLSALILNSAAQLKAHVGVIRGVQKHSQEARWRLLRIIEFLNKETKPYLGLSLPSFIRSIEIH